jgi:hypothetical protein
MGCAEHERPDHAYSSERRSDCRAPSRGRSLARTSRRQRLRHGSATSGSCKRNSIPAFTEGRPSCWSRLTGTRATGRPGRPRDRRQRPTCATFRAGPHRTLARCPARRVLGQHGIHGAARPCWRTRAPTRTLSLFGSQCSSDQRASLGWVYGISQPRTYRHEGQPTLPRRHDVRRLG